MGITQLLGLAIFYLTSKFLSKDDFGQFNWCTSVASTFIAIASLGLDLVFVKRIASGKNSWNNSGIHFFHTLFSGVTLCLILVVIQFAFPHLLNYYALFFLVFIHLTIANLANSLKLCLNGLEKYRTLSLIAICTNVFKFSLILFLYFWQHFSINNIALAFIVVSLLEFGLSYWFVWRYFSKPLKPLLLVEDYKHFIYESLPQLGVVIFDSALARIDWIILGIISTATITADYSFTYKVFELSKLPLLIIAPILLTRFSRLFNSSENLDQKKKQDIHSLFKIELFIAMLIPIVMICIWSDFVDYATDNKYGKVNVTTYTILAACVPMHYIINFLWTMGFVQGQLKTIMFITITISVINILANLFLIPYYGALGAAIAFVCSASIQLILYLVLIKQTQLRLDLKSCILPFFNAFLAIAISLFFEKNCILTAVLAVILYSFFSVITGTININTFKQLKSTS